MKLIFLVLFVCLKIVFCDYYRWDVKSENPTPDDKFGEVSAFIKNEWLAIAGTDNGRGAVYIYHYDQYPGDENPDWYLIKVIKPPEDIETKSFGYSLSSVYSSSLKAFILAIGSPSAIPLNHTKMNYSDLVQICNDNKDSTDNGYAFIYAMVEEQKDFVLRRTYSYPSPLFGTSVNVIYRGILSVGSPAEKDNDGSICGAVHIYNLQDDSNEGFHVIFEGLSQKPGVEQVNPMFGVGLTANSDGIVIGGIQSSFIINLVGNIELGETVELFKLKCEPLLIDMKKCESGLIEESELVNGYMGATLGLTLSSNSIIVGCPNCSDMNGNIHIVVGAMQCPSVYSASKKKSERIQHDVTALNYHPFNSDNYILSNPLRNYIIDAPETGCTNGLCQFGSQISMDSNSASFAVTAPNAISLSTSNIIKQELNNNRQNIYSNKQLINQHIPNADDIIIDKQLGVPGLNYRFIFVPNESSNSNNNKYIQLQQSKDDIYNYNIPQYNDQILPSFNSSSSFEQITSHFKHHTNHIHSHQDQLNSFNRKSYSDNNSQIDKGQYQQQIYIFGGGAMSVTLRYVNPSTGLFLLVSGPPFQSQMNESQRVRIYLAQFISVKYDFLIVILFILLIVLAVFLLVIICIQIFILIRRRRRGIQGEAEEIHDAPNQEEGQI